MKLVVFAHTPPPVHGQSYMVQLMLEGFGGDRRHHTGTPPQPDYGIQCYHVNARVSKNLEDIGGVRFGKLFLLLGHCCQAIWCRLRYGASTLYYVPAPGKAASLYRDWLVMFLCRPFFRHAVFHWHATSLAKWLETSTTLATRRLTFRLLGRADLSIVLSQSSRATADKLWPHRIAVVPNGIPDPCPQFSARVLPRRQARLAARKKLLAGQELSTRERAEAGDQAEFVRVLFLAHCTREKGLFDAVHAVLLANERLRAQGLPVAFHLMVGGVFPNPEEKEQFDQLCRPGPAGHAIHYAGFLQGPQKAEAMIEADLLCFPSHWESFGLVLVEAMAFGMPMVTTRCGAVPEVMPAGYPGLAEVGAAGQLASALVQMAQFEDFTGLRQHFLDHFTLQKFFSNLAATLQGLEPSPRRPLPTQADSNPACPSTFPTASR